MIHSNHEVTKHTKHTTSISYKTSYKIASCLFMFFVSS